MTEIKVKIPAELESEFELIPKPELSLLFNRLLMENLSRIARFKQIVSKSRLTEDKAEELADEISISLAKKYDKISPE
jgi:hypothetical protein